ncbi:hypothetical protein DFH09DRAFT_1041780, partial [Mycena vulgaris]
MSDATQTNKRPRDGNDDTPPAKRLTVIHIASDDASLSAKPPKSSLPVPDAWISAIEACIAQKVQIPPTVVLEYFGTIRADALKEYQGAQKQLQKARVTFERFNQASDNGSVPSIVSSAMKVPNLQLLKGTPDVSVTDPDAVLAKCAADEACTTARTSATDYVRAMYIAQVVHCEEGVDTAKCADRLSAALTAYGTEIIQSAQSNGDVHIWDACIVRLRTAFQSELTMLSYDFAAKVRNEAADKETKANAVTTARAAAETSNAARPIQELLKDEGSEGGPEREARRKARRRGRKAQETRAQGQEGQSEAGVAGQRLRVTATPPPLPHDVLSWVSPPGRTFHHHRPDTYPDPFFTAPIDVRTKFVTSKMTPLYYDTRLINRAFHNLTNVELSAEQAKLLALNPKFV